MTVKERLIAARNLVAAGWVQGRTTSPPLVRRVAKYCALGAVEKVCGLYDNNLSQKEWRKLVDEDYRETLQPIFSFLGAGHGYGESAAIVAFNDTSGRTQAEVVEMFDGVIARFPNESP
jgi:hypothetical protein